MKDFRFAIYCRKSTDTEDKQVLSLESQEKELLEIATREDLQIVKVLKERMSAKAPGRPVFNELVSLIDKNKIDAILCWKIDRLTRNPIDAGYIQWLLQTSRIKCIKTFERAFYPSENVLLINIEQAMATQYIRDLSTNVKRGNRTKLEKGEWPNKAPFGYLNDKLTKKIIVDKQNARYITRAFELYGTGKYTLKEISDHLYNEGLRTGSGRKIIKSHIHRILKSSFYCGLMNRDGKLYQGNHATLITIKQYEQVQDILLGRKHPRPRKRFYPVRGFLTCGQCGCTLTADTQKGHTYYYCTNGRGNCSQHKKYLRSESVDTIVSTVLDELKFSGDEIEILSEACRQRYEDTHDLSKMILERLSIELQALTQRESLLVDGYTSQIISEEVYRAKMLEIENKRVELKQQIQHYEPAAELPQVTFEQVKNIFQQGNLAAKLYLQGTNEMKRNHLISILSNIVIKDQKILSYQFKSPYDILAKAPKNADFQTKLAVWDAIRTSLITSYSVPSTETERRLLREAG